MPELSRFTMSIELQIEALAAEVRGLSKRIDDLTRLIERETPAEMSTEEFSERVNRAPFTVRAWCREGRIKSRKDADSGKFVISRDELLRYQAEGLLAPQSPASVQTGTGAGSVGAVRPSDALPMRL